MIGRTFSFFRWACFVVGCSSCLCSAASLMAGESVTVMTYNIRFDVGGTQPTAGTTAWLAQSGAHRRDLVLEVIASQQPDLLAVQEAYANQAADIATHLSGHDWYAIGRDDGKAAGEHCAIYWNRNRFDAIAKGTFWLSEQANEPGSLYPGAACTRIASWVRLKDHTHSNREILFVNTHWDHVSEKARRFSAISIADFLRAEAEQASIILAGDMNAVEDSPAMQHLISSKYSKLIDAYRTIHPEVSDEEATFSSFQNRIKGRRIDYVLHSASLVPISAELVRTTFDGRNASDHFPVVVDLTWTADD